MQIKVFTGLVANIIITNNQNKRSGGEVMIKELINFNTVDKYVDKDEYNYCINSNFEMLYNKINEIINVINEMKLNEVRNEEK